MEKSQTFAFEAESTDISPKLYKLLNSFFSGRKEMNMKNKSVKTFQNLDYVCMENFGIILH